MEALLDEVVRAEAFVVTPPGMLRIERSPGVCRVFLDRPDMPSDQPVIELRADGEIVRVSRHVAMRDGSWLEEHVATTPPQRELLERCIAMCLVGTSRLPITSIETPLPVYSLGMLAYRSDDRARRLDVALRTGSEVPNADAATLRSLFNLLTLSPLTPHLTRLLALLRHHPDGSSVTQQMIRHLVRHLNAFDLERFHNRGANYPDGLFLDGLLRILIERFDDSPAARAALLHGALARKRMEGTKVPATPTSPGEAARFMPGWYVRGEPDARVRTLFRDESTDAMLTPQTRESLRLAATGVDAIELGRATFLDRPLGVMKRGEADRTAMLSYESFSRRLARRRAGEVPASIDIPQLTGFPVAKLPGHARDGVVSLEDAKKVALDFVFTRTTRSSLATLLRQYDFSAALSNAGAPDAYRWLCDDPHVLLIRSGRAAITAFDRSMRPRFALDLSDARYREFAGEEFAEGVRLSAAGSAPLPPRF